MLSYTSKAFTYGCKDKVRNDDNEQVPLALGNSFNMLCYFDDFFIFNVTTLQAFRISFEPFKKVSLRMKFSPIWSYSQFSGDIDLRHIVRVALQY